MVEAHQRVVASLEAGWQALATTSATAMSRSAQAGPRTLASPSDCAIAHTAATWPWGRDRVTSKASLAATSVLPARLARTASIASGGKWERLARVSVFTLPASR